MTEEHLPPETNTSWTHFWDMHSGGDPKTDYQHIFVELPEAAAIRWFEQRFDRDPQNVTCDCCGEDFSISTSETLEQATAFHRNCDYDKDLNKYVERANYGTLISLESFCLLPDILVVRRHGAEGGTREGAR